MKELITHWAEALRQIVQGSDPDGCDDRFRKISIIADEMTAAVSGKDAAVPGKAAAGRSTDELSMAIIHKLAQEYFRIFYVDVTTDEYSSYDPYCPEDTLDLDNIIPDFFLQTSGAMFDTLYEDDRESFFSAFKREKFIESVKKTGEYTIVYRVMDKGAPVFVSMKATQLENDPDHLIVGVSNIDSQVRREAALLSKLEMARTEANTDALTGVRNKHAFIDYEAELKHKVEEDQIREFAILVFDVNNLKVVNDNLGHHAGDSLIKESSSIICNCFKRSPVFRIGGDEFAVICTGYDYEHLDEKLDYIAAMNERNSIEGGVVIATGMARYQGNETISAVFDRADADMYENKRHLKSCQRSNLQ